MKISKEELKTIIREAFEDELGPEREVNWNTRSLSIVTMLTSINSSLAGIDALMKEQNDILRELSRNPSDLTAQRLNR